MTYNKRSVAPKALVRFLSETLPFSELDKPTLADLAQHWVIEFYLKGTIILQQDVTEVNHLCVIQKGGVKAYFMSADTVTTLKELGGEGAAFGALSMVHGHKADLTVEAVEDTFVFLLGKDTFLQLIQDNPRLERFYLQGFSEDFIMAAYSELRCEKVRARKDEALYLFNTTVRDIVQNPAEFVDQGTTVQQAAARMAQCGIGSLLVRGPAGEIAGIVTDTDLRRKVVAAGLDYGTAVEKIMASPVRTVSGEALCFDALVRIIQQQVDHLAVEHQEEILGVVTSHDIMAYQGAWPLYLFREINAPRDFDALSSLSQKVPVAIRTLIEEGAKAGNITRVITMLNDGIVKRILTLLSEDMGQPPVDFAWLTLGSDGRREQAFRLEQDTSLVYSRPRDRYERQTAEVYFETLAAKATDLLVSCGFPKCKSGVSASNPRWCQPFYVWENYFEEWMSTPEPREVSNAMIFFDFRSVFGDMDLARDLRKGLTGRAQHQHMFLTHLAADCLVHWPPLGFFRNFVVEKDGEQKSRLDLKTRCLNPFVNFARLMALRFGIEETNTLDRLRRLEEEGHIARDFHADAREAYEFQIQLNLVHQLEMAEAGLTPDNFVDPAELTDLERKTLREAFAVIDRMLVQIKQEFPAAV